MHRIVASVVRPFVIACAVSAVAAGASGSQAAVRKVLIIGIDGLRPDALAAADAPSIDALIADGAYSASAQAEDITISGPGWSSMLTGVHRDKHGVTGNSFVGSNYEQYPHFFERLEAACDTRTVSIANWAPINTTILRNRADLVLTGGPDSLVAQRAADVLGSQDMDVLFVAFDEVDGAGHSFGFDPSVPQYLAKIAETDGRVGQILTAMRARPTFASEDWLIVLTADHGGTIDRTHGRNIPEHRTIPFLVSGSSSARGTTITPAPQLPDLAPTVMAFLGVAVNPAWGWDGQPVGLDLAGSTSTAWVCTPPPPPPPPALGACCLADGSCTIVIAGACASSRGVWQGLASVCGGATCAARTVVWTQNFDSVPLGPSVDETPAGALVWSATPPAGWGINNAGLPGGGVTEWRGWSFVSPSWWAQVAGDQGRAGFTKGVGAIAIADPDEWDDLSRSAGSYNTRLTTPAIPISGLRAGTAVLAMDSSWLPESPQRAEITVSFDGGAPVLLADWRSVPGANFKDGATNETLVIPLNNRAGAATARVTFALLDAGNNWWWGLDNLEVSGVPAASRRVLLAEGFDALPLGPSVDETPPTSGVWTPTPPAGWAVDNSGLPTGGVTEWRGWTFAQRAWWSAVAVDQGRSGFARGTGTVAVADPDEWFDLPRGSGTFNTRLTSPAIALGSARSGLRAAFDSSWRAEGVQRAELAARFADSSGNAVGTPLTLLDWRSAAGASFKPDATNEAVTLEFAAPPNAASVRLTFALLDAGNNWWWAIDNVTVTAPACLADFDGSGEVAVTDIFVYLSAWFAREARADVDGSAGIGVADIFAYLSAWFARC